MTLLRRTRHAATHARRPSGAATKPVLGSVAVIAALVLVLAALPTAGAVFSGTATNPGNSFAAGTVTITSNDSSPAGSLLTMSDGRPGDAPVVGCVRVTYTGNVPAQVRLYGTAGGSGLGQYLNLTIERGTLASGTLPTCTGFTPDGNTYAAANGVVFTGTLAGFATAHGTYANALPDPTAASPTTWTTGTTVAYRFTATIQNDSAAQGLTAAPTFWWEARDL